MADKPKVAESGVLRACLDLLAVERIWAIRMNVGAVKDGKRFFRFGRKGMADILALPALTCGSRCCLPPSDPDERTLWENRHCQRLNTKAVWIECKSCIGTQRPEQKEFQQEVEAYGHQYLLVRDVSELQDWLKRNST